MATPAAPANSQYKFIYYWVAQDVPCILHAEIYDQDGRKVREMHASGLRKVSGIWGARKTEMRSPLDGTKSVLTIDEIHLNTGSRRFAVHSGGSGKKLTAAAKLRGALRDSTGYSAARPGAQEFVGSSLLWPPFSQLIGARISPICSNCSAQERQSTGRASRSVILPTAKPKNPASLTQSWKAALDPLQLPSHRWPQAGERALLFYSGGLDFIAAFWGCLLRGRGRGSRVSRAPAPADSAPAGRSPRIPKQSLF